MLIRLLRETYDPEQRSLTLFVEPLRHSFLAEWATELGETSEDIADTKKPDGLLNFAACKYPEYDPQILRLVTGSTPFMTLPVANEADLQVATSATPQFEIESIQRNENELPPGVLFDETITPIAPLHATNSEKMQAILQVAQSQLGIPFIWGHYANHGDIGFDSSSFVQFVYRSALGYTFSRRGHVQATTVGVFVSYDDLQTGDLLICNNGSMVGLYAGEGKMIAAGGGLGRVGYLRMDAGSYWQMRITAIKRLL